MPNFTRRHLAIWLCMLTLGALRLQATLPDSLRLSLGGLPDSAQVKELISRSNAVMYRDPDAGIRYMDLAEEIATEADLPRWLAGVTNMRGTLAWIKGDYDAALRHYRAADSAFTAQGNALGAAKAQNNIGLVYQDMSYLDLSLEAYLKAATYFEAQPDRRPLATIYNNIGNVHNASGDDAQAIAYYTKGLKLFEEFEDVNGQCMAHSNLGLIVNHQGNTTSAIAHFTQAIDGYVKLDYPLGRAKVLVNLASVYADSGLFERSESLHTEALALAEKVNSPAEISVVQLKMGEMYLKWGRYPEAIALANASLRSGAGTTALVAEASTHEVLAHAYRRSGRMDSAYVHLDRYHTLKDSVYNINKANAIEEMKIKFDLTLKDKEIENLAQQQRLDNLLKWALAGLLLLLLALGAVIYSRQRAVIRREQALKENERQMHETQKALAEAELKTKSLELRAAESEQARLQGEIGYKSREISSLAMSILRQNDLLEVLDRELKALRKGADEQKLKDLSLLVSQTLSLDNERQELQLYIQEAQQNFFQKLEAEFPDLSAKEKRLCAMIKMGLSSKEIAAVFNIAIASVEVARHRLRKKLNLDPNASLKEFLDTF